MLSHPAQVCSGWTGSALTYRDYVCTDRQQGKHQDVLIHGAALLESLCAFRTSLQTHLTGAAAGWLTWQRGDEACSPKLVSLSSNALTRN